MYCPGQDKNWVIGLGFIVLEAFHLDDAHLITLGVFHLETSFSYAQKTIYLKKQGQPTNPNAVT